jgi:hypothetical protein
MILIAARGISLTLRALLKQAVPDLADPLAAGKARRLEGLLADATGQPPNTAAILLDAAGMIAPHDRRLARDTLLEAFWMAHRAGRFGVGMAEALRAARATPPIADSPATVADLLLDGFAALSDHRDEAGVRKSGRRRRPGKPCQPKLRATLRPIRHDLR